MRIRPGAAAALGSGTLGATVARAMVTTSASQVAIVVLVFVTSIAQARLLGAAGRGQLALFMNATAIVVLICGLGINSAITYFVASGAAQPRALLRTLRPAYALTVLTVLGLAAVITVSGLRRFLPASLPDGWLVLALTLYFALTQAGSWLAAVLAARRAFTPINATAVLVAGTGTAVSVALLWLSPAWANVPAIIALVVGLEGFRTILLGGSLVRRRWHVPLGAAAATGATEHRLTFVQLWRYSGLTFAVNSLQFLTYRSDQWIVDAFHGTAELGVYALAVSLAQLVWIVPTAAASVLFPYAAALETPSSAQLALRAARVALLVSTACGVAGWIASELFVVTLFGQEFAEVPSLIWILLLGIVPFSVAKVLGNYLAGSNAVGSNAVATTVTLVIAVGLALLLIPGMGAAGAAWATAIAYSLQTLFIMALFRHRTALPLRTVMLLRVPR